jgi:hypothetical protein
MTKTTVKLDNNVYVCAKPIKCVPSGVSLSVILKMILKSFHTMNDKSRLEPPWPIVRKYSSLDSVTYGRLKISWTYLITPSLNFVEVR